MNLVDPLPPCYCNLSLSSGDVKYDGVYYTLPPP